MPCIAKSPDCNNARTGQTYGVLSGYSTSTGYDLATGLGSVDAANLVNNWQSVSFNPSTTTLSVNGGSPVNIPHGAALPFAVAVSPASATGQIALMVAPGTPGNPGIAAFPLNSGSVNTSSTLLPGGTYSLLAHYGGDSNYGGSYSNAVPVVVASEPGKVLANLVTVDGYGIVTSYAASSATYGSGYPLLRIDVGDANATVLPASGISSLCSARKENCPTGKITLTAPGTPLNGSTMVLNSEGYAQVPVPSGGSFSITAAYPGDPSFSAATGTANFTMIKAPVTATASSALNDQYGAPISVSSNVTTTSLGIAPTGTVQFFVDGNSVSASPFVAASSGYQVTNGVARYAYVNFAALSSGFSVGNHTLSAAYSGDTNYAANTSPTVTFSVARGDPAISAGAINGAVVNQAFTLQAQVFKAPYGVPPTGTVSFTIGGVPVTGTVTYSTQPSNQALVATISTTVSSIGESQVYGTYSGDANYAPGTSGSTLDVLGPLSIQQQPGYVVVSSPGQNGSSTLTITPNGTFTGTVSLACKVDPKAAESTCSFTSGPNSGSTLQVPVGTGGAMVTFNVGTTAPHPVAKVDPMPLGTAATVALCGVFAVFLPMHKRYRRLSLCLVVTLIAFGLGACSSGGSGSSSGGGGSGSGGGGTTQIDAGTQLGNYVFNITATTGTGSTQIVQNVLETVTVN